MGETYLVGPDKLMRLDSRFSDESTIFNQEVDTAIAHQGLAGESGFERLLSYRGVPVLSAFKPLDTPGVNWDMLSHKNCEPGFMTFLALIGEGIE